MFKALRDLWRLLGSYRQWYLLASMLAILAILFRSFEPRVLQLVVDYVVVLPLGGPAPGTDIVTDFLLGFLPPLEANRLGGLLLGLAIMYLVLSVFRGVSVFTAEAIKNWATDRVAKVQRDDAFAHIQRLPLSYFTRITRGELIQRLTGDVDTVKNFLRGQVFSLIRILSVFVFAFCMMAITDWVFALICISLAPFILTLSLLFFRKEKEVWKQHEKESDKLNTLVQENLNGIRTVIAYANEEHEVSRFKEQNEAKRKMGFRHNLLHTFFWPTSDFLTYLQIVISIVVGGYFTVQGRISIGELLSFYTYINMLSWPVRDLGRVLSQMGMATVALERLGEINEAEEEDANGETYTGVEGEIALEQVSFRYKPEDEFALENVSLHIHPGEKVAIIGPTGSGKSTLIKLLLRLYEPESGAITLDGKPLGTFKRGWLRQHIGLALQQPFLFSTSVRENIAYTDPEKEVEEVYAAAKTAQAYDLQEIMPQGFDTLVGEKGVTLSGGQKQRVALARTLLPKPAILVLDDITSAVDTETEQAIFDALETWLADQTTLIISHRVTSIQQADRILVLDQGRLVQQGTPEELAKHPGYFQEIMKVQAAVEANLIG